MTLPTIVVPAPNGVDDTASIQATINAAEAGTFSPIVLFQPGNYLISNSITVNSTRGTILTGCGAEGYGTNVTLTTDLGAGKFAFDATGNGPWQLHNMLIQGPQVNSDVYGTAPNNTFGVKMRGRSRISGCLIRTFYAGVVITTDHTAIEHSNLSGYYSVYFRRAASSGMGDHLFSNVNMEGAKFASIGVHTNSSITAATFRRCHLGVCPFGIFKENAADSISSIDMLAGDSGFTMLDVNMDTVSIEDFGHALIYAHGTSWINGVRMIDNSIGSNNFAPAKQIGGWDKDAVISCSTISDFHILGGGFGSAATIGDLAFWKVDSFSDVKIEDAGFLMQQLETSPTKRYAVNWSGGTSWPYNNISAKGNEIGWGIGLSGGGTTWRPGSARGVPLYVESTVSHLQLVGPGSGVPLRGVPYVAGGGTMPLGAAVGDASAGDVVVIATSGCATIRCDAAAGFTTGGLVKPHATINGRVAPAANWADGPIIGTYIEAGTVPALDTAHVMLRPLM